MPDLVPIRRALVSVSDKTGLIAFVQALASRGVEIISTGGTAGALRAAGVAVTPIDAVTGFPEIMGGRVKTLHPKVHGGLLGLRDDPEHRAQMSAHQITPIDLVCVNLYPFEQTAAKPGCTPHEAIEQIDIGGPSMIRSASKNHEWVAVVTNPSQYERVLAEVAANKGATGAALRSELAAEAFALTARYDSAIAAYMSKKPATMFPPLLTTTYVKAEDLRYGENPHQAAALYRRPGPGAPGTVACAEQLHGKDLSYNNLLDASAAQELALALKRASPSKIGACVVKHTNPCGAALADSVHDAVDEAIASDPVASYGGILAVSDALDEQTAARLADRSIFLEVVIAPRFTAGALRILQEKSASLRLLAAGEAPPAPEAAPIEARTLPGGLLVQERDLKAAKESEIVHRAGPLPTRRHLDLAHFLEAVARFLFSNAVVIGGPSTMRPGSLQMYGAGAGQMDRVTACRIAVEKAGGLAATATAYSDAFFPFADGPTILANAGVKCIVHPGGSKRDQETFDLCESRGITCLTTGVRHFRH